MDRRAEIARNSPLGKILADIISCRDKIKCKNAGDNLLLMCVQTILLTDNIGKLRSYFESDVNICSNFQFDLKWETYVEYKYNCPSRETFLIFWLLSLPQLPNLLTTELHKLARHWIDQTLWKCDQLFFESDKMFKTFKIFKVANYYLKVTKLTFKIFKVTKYSKHKCSFPALFIAMLTLLLWTLTNYFLRSVKFYYFIEDCLLSFPTIRCNSQMRLISNGRPPQVKLNLVERGQGKHTHT